MTFDLATVAGRLRTGDVESAGDLPAPDEERVRATIGRLRTLGRSARVAALPRGADLAAWHPLFDAAGLDDKRDLLMLWNGRRLEARGWGLPPGRIHEVLVTVEPLIAAEPGQAITRALEALARMAGALERRAQGDEAPVPPLGEGGGGQDELPSLAVLGGAGIAATLAISATALVIRRRARRAAEIGRDLTAALESAEQRFAELMLAAEELGDGPGGGRDLQLRAGRLKQRLDALGSEARSDREVAADPLTLGRIRQLENEIAALRSSALSRRGR